MQKADTIRMENLDIRAKEWGIKMGQEPSIPFKYDRVIDVWTANNIYLAHNQYGLWSQGWVSNVRIRNVRPQHKSPIAWVVAAPCVFAWADGWLLCAQIFGYINQKSLIHAQTMYDWLIDGVMSQADVSAPPTPLPIFFRSPSPDQG